MLQYNNSTLAQTINAPLVQASTITNYNEYQQTKALPFTKALANICLSFQQKKKWILVINSATQSIKELANHINIDSSKILNIDVNKIKVEFNNIELAVSKGNCSAIVLCEKSFSHQQIAQLKAKAENTKTSLVILQQQNQLH